MAVSSAPAGSFDGPSLFWYDLETFGLSPVWDRPAQFAGLRTDLDLNEVGLPRILYCRPPADYLPDPSSCLVTGITPAVAEREGVCEAEFIAAIRSEFMVPGTCVAGYNNLRFDDEVVRHALYRNLFDPYEREWRNGNSRWDIIDMIRLVAAVRPDGMSWPLSDDGLPSFRLDRLTIANGIEHGNAHDALADVRATIALARRVRDVQPKLFDFVFRNRGRHAASDLLQLGRFEPVVHVSGRYPAARFCLAPVVALAADPTNRNGIAVYDLSVDPRPMISLEVEEIRRRVFTPTAELEEGVLRVPLKIVHLNKCPVIAPWKVLRPADLERLAIDTGAVMRHLDWLRDAPDLSRRISAVFAEQPRPGNEDPDALLYGGGFLGDKDRQALDFLHRQAVEDWPRDGLVWDDRRLPEMVFRYRARNYPETLDADEAGRWQEFCRRRLQSPMGGPVRGYEAFRAAVAELRGASSAESVECGWLDEIVAWAERRQARLDADLPYT